MISFFIVNQLSFWCWYYLQITSFMNWPQARKDSPSSKDQKKAVVFPAHASIIIPPLNPLAQNEKWIFSRRHQKMPKTHSVPYFHIFKLFFGDRISKTSTFKAKIFQINIAWYHTSFLENSEIKWLIIKNQKVAKRQKFSLMLLINVKQSWEIFWNFCGLLRIYELYWDNIYVTEDICAALFYPSPDQKYVWLSLHVGALSASPLLPDFQKFAQKPWDLFQKCIKK